MTDVRERLRSASESAPPPEDPFERLTRRRERRRRRSRLGTGAFALLLTAGVLGGMLWAFAPGRGAVVRTGAFGTSAAPALGEGQYLYERWTNVNPGVGFVLQTWWATDGSGRVAWACTDAGCDRSYGLPPQGVFGAGAFPADSDTSGLSADPDTLRQQLLDRTASGGASPEPGVSPGPEIGQGVTEGGLLYAIDNLLEDPNGPPELKAAVFEVARGLHSVEESSGTDPAGREAVVLAFAYNGDSARQYFFDPSTHLLMAIEASDSVYQVYDQAIVSSTDATPAEGDWLFTPSAP